MSLGKLDFERGKRRRECDAARHACDENKNIRQESYSEVDDAPATWSSGGEIVGSTPCLNGKCLLCLSTYCRHPTVTPCGHVFCW